MGAVAAIVAIGLIAGLYAVLHDSPKAQAGCIQIPAAHAVGGATVKACGADAIGWCRSTADRRDWLGSAVQDRCGRAGYR
jgi:hypothetical protein